MMSPEPNKVHAFQRGLQYNGDCNFPPSYQDVNTIPVKNINNILPDMDAVFNLILWASKILQKHAIDSPRLDAEIILSYLLNCRRIDLYTHPDKLVEDAIAERYKQAIQRRAQRVPLQYITNHAEFMSLDFYVDERVLIPRPETELIVEAVIEKSENFSNEQEILIIDIGVGSGNIAVALAKKIQNARIFAIDISSDALAVAKINAQRHQVLDKITFLCGNIFEPLNGYRVESKVNFIVSNPPYVSSDELSTLQAEVRNFEPHVALISGQDGLSLFRDIIKNANRWLKPGGFLLLEVGETQARKVAQMLRDTGRFKKAEYRKDYQHIHRTVITQLEENCG